MACLVEGKCQNQFPRRFCKKRQINLFCYIKYTVGVHQKRERVSVLAAVSWSINQSIDQWNYHWLRDAARICFRNLTNSIYLAKTNVLMLRTSKWLLQNLCVEDKRKGIIDWRGTLCSDAWQLCWKIRRLDKNQVTWPTIYGSGDCTCENRTIKQTAWRRWIKHDKPPTGSGYSSRASWQHLI